MAEGAESIVLDLYARGLLDGILALGGSGGSSIAARAMRALPVGVPKLLVSTVASGDTRPYVGAVDVTMMYSVVDISGVNSVSARIMANAAAAIAGMAGATLPKLEGKPLVAATHVRRHDSVRDARSRAARRARLRGARLPCHGCRRPVDGGARRRRVRGGRARRDDDRAGGRACRRRALRGARPARGGRRGRRAAGRLTRRARHGQLRPARDRAAAVRGAEPLRPQPDRDADAHDAGGVRRARAHRSAGSCRRRPGRPPSSSRSAGSR